MQTCKILILLLAISPQNKTTTQKVHFICKLNCRTSPAKTAKVKQLAIIFFCSLHCSQLRNLPTSRTRASQLGQLQKQTFLVSPDIN